MRTQRTVFSELQGPHYRAAANLKANDRCRYNRPPGVEDRMRRAAMRISIAVVFICAVGHQAAAGNDDSARVADRAAMVRRIDELVEARIRLAGYLPATHSSDEEFL